MRFILDDGLRVPPRPRISFVADREIVRREHEVDGRVRVILPRSYDPGEALADQLEFALKHEGVDLVVLATWFKAASVQERAAVAITEWVRRTPKGQYARLAWFFFEFLTGRRLDLPDAKSVHYVPALDPSTYVVGPAVRSRRHGVIDNLLGPRAFCPTVRITERIRNIQSARLKKEAAALIGEYGDDVLRRAVDYLYTKETRSSFKLEGEVPDTQRAFRFIDVLHRLELPEALDEREFTRLQNAIVLPGAEDAGYRTESVYIGEQLDLRRQQIHFVAPRPEDVPSMMNGLRETMERMLAAGIDPIVNAAVTSFGFVFIHPFTDGNGRIHRALIHHVLSRTGFTPQGVLLPVSAVILRRKREYDAALESVSRPLMRLIDFDELEDGRIHIRNETSELYRFLDLTSFAEALADWTEQTINTELKEELEFVRRYRTARERIENVVDLPDRLLNVFIQVVAANQGRLSERKRALFDRLTDAQIAALEEIVRDEFDLR